MSTDISFTPAAQIDALFQGARHEISVQLPEPENVTIVFTENVQQHCLLQEAPRMSVNLVAGVPSTPNAGISGFAPADISTATDTHLFFGYSGTNWLIRRTDRGAGAKAVARSQSNPTIYDFAAAWLARDTLTYEGSV